MVATACFAALMAVISVAVRSATTKADFDTLVSYFAAGSATWQQDNADPGEGKATHWVRRHTVDGDLSTTRVVGVFADGRCEPVTTIEHRWFVDDSSIRTSSTTAGGLAFGGHVEALDDSRFQTTAGGTLPDGTELKMRDVTDLSVPDSSLTRAERWAGDRWVPLDTATWRRVAADAWCGESED